MPSPGDARHRPYELDSVERIEFIQSRKIICLSIDVGLSASIRIGALRSGLHVGPHVKQSQKIVFDSG